MKNLIWSLLGILLGFAIGIGYAWVIHPADLQGSTPNALRAEYRGEYLLLIASSYRTTEDLSRARNRLAAFPGLDAGQLASLAQQVAASGGGDQTARDLAILALALGKQTAIPNASRTPRETSASVINSPIPNWEPTMAVAISPLPIPAAQTLLPSAMSEVRFRLQSKETFCGGTGKQSPQIQVWVKTADGKGKPGVELKVRWMSNEGSMVTGMKPDVDAGYADFDMVPGVVYEVAVGNSILTASGLSAPDCATSGGGAAFGSIRLVFLSL
jgi:hypothetical protein